jgi:DsbC/DsbD-like thiol-disulfide interchange protein
MIGAAALLAAVCAGVTVRAEGVGDPAATAAAAAPEPIRARLVCEEGALVAGGVAEIGVVLEIAPSWHLFWNGCNTTGYPITVTPRLPDGFRAREIAWPAPKRLVSPGDILDHVYEEETALVLPIEVPADARSGDEVTLRCRVDWVACRDACIVGGEDVSLRLPVVARAEREHAARIPALDAARRAWPRRLPPDETWIRYHWARGALVIEADGADSLEFYPADGCEWLVDPIADCAGASGRLSIRCRAAGGEVGRISGVVRVVARRDGAPRAVGSSLVEIEVPGPTAPESRDHRGR